MSVSSISISNDSKTFAISFENMFHVYTIDPIDRKYQKEFPRCKIVNIATIPGGTYVAFVAWSKKKSDSTVYLWNNFYGECHDKIDFNSRVIRVSITPQNLLIVLDNSFCVYDISSKTIQMKEKTYTNTNGAADLCQSNDTALLAVCSDQMGYAKVLEIGSNNQPIVFQAAKHPVSYLKFSNDGLLLATASEKGTLIRIFDSYTGAALCVFRRGALTSKVLSMSFSPNNQFLVATSENGTIHLFPSDVRNANASDPPRASAKFKIDKTHLVSSIFRKDNELIVISGGCVYFLKCGIGKIDLLKKVLAYQIE